MPELLGMLYEILWSVFVSIGWNYCHDASRQDPFERMDSHYLKYQRGKIGDKLVIVVSGVRLFKGMYSHCLEYLPREIGEKFFLLSLNMHI